MIDKLKVCFYILISDRYAVFTTTKTGIGNWEKAFSSLRNVTAAFLMNAIQIIRETAEEYKQNSETVLNEIDNEQTNN